MIEPTTKLDVDAELLRDLGVVLARLLLDVDAGEPHREPEHVAEEPVRREGQVGVAAAEVDDPERVVGGRSAQVPLVEGRRERGVEQPEELLHLAELGLPARLDPALAVGQTERPEQRVVGGEQPLLVPVVATLGLDRLLAVLAVHDRLVRLRDPELVALGRRLDVPAGERLVQQRVHRVPGLALLTQGSDRVVVGVRLRGVVRRDLEVTPRLEVDVTELGPAPGRRRALLPAGGHRPHQDLRVEQVAAHPGEGAEQGLAHLSTAARTTTSSSPASATGMTRRRWRGFTAQG